MSIAETFKQALNQHQAGDLAQAERGYRQVLDLDPGHVDALHLLGVLAHQTGRNDIAVKNIQDALRLRPNFAEAHFNLGIVYGELGNQDEEAACFEQAARCKPNYAQAQVLLGNACKELGRIDEALAAYRAAAQLRPNAADVRSKLILLLNYHPAYDPPRILEECRRWNELFAEPLQASIEAHGNDRDPNRRLRVGYVSAGFSRHSLSLFLIPLLEHHDHEQVEVFCYSGVTSPDDITARTRRTADVWRDTAGLADEQVAAMIRSDRIDILVDLGMHMAENRLLVFARKPAPVQVAWLAYPGTTGVKAIDYRLTDPYLDPPGLCDAYYSERSMRLPDTFWCYDPLTDETEVAPLPALRNGHVTFGSLNSFCKINDGVLALWAQVLQAVPESRLLMLAPVGRAREHVLAALGGGGVTAARVEFVDRLPRLDYLKLYHRIDLGLEPFPANGHTTSLDAFWMGVPTCTLVGPTIVGRAGWSQLNNLELKELAADSPERYVEITAALAGSLSRLQELRATARARMRQSPLMNGQRFARHVEDAYRRMWRTWCRRAGGLPK